ncbi:MAG: metallophosphoesterase [Solirubrobacteraceae bacterium]
MRTLVISDLHLGARTGVGVLHQPAPLEALVAALDAIDRLVLLGDTIELRQGPAAEALEAAAPVLAALGAAMAEGEIVLVPGNHDHALTAPWAESRGRALALDERAAPAEASPLAAAVAAALAPAATTVAYPGLWLAEGVYATHGHYLDVHGTVPAYERLSAGVLARALGGPPATGAVPDDYESVLAPMYALLGAVAARATPGRPVRGTGAAGRAWRSLTHEGRRPLRARLAVAAFPVAIAAINRAGIGPVRGDLSGDALRRGGLHGMREALRRLGVGAETVIFGHTHRTGPLPADDAREWTGLLNTGSWVHEPHFVGREGSAGPYWPGGAALVEPGRPPVLLRVLADVAL